MPPRPVKTVIYSIRLPVAVDEKIRMLCERFPEKTRTKITIDLLVHALAEFEKSHPARFLEDFSDCIPY